MEDEPAVSHLTEAMLSRLGYQVTTVSEGQSALEAFAQAQQDKLPFAVTILDLTVENGMGGIETFEGLTQLDPAVVALVFSGYDTGPDGSDILTLGFKGRIPKPYRLDELRVIMDAAIK
jgi:two-component system cell cycle sensor histidine kinase/response regulator CckA